MGRFELRENGLESLLYIRYIITVLDEKKLAGRETLSYCSLALRIKPLRLCTRLCAGMCLRTARCPRAHMISLAVAVFWRAIDSWVPSPSSWESHPFDRNPSLGRVPDDLDADCLAPKVLKRLRTPRLPGILRMQLQTRDSSDDSGFSGCGRDAQCRPRT